MNIITNAVLQLTNEREKLDLAIKALGHLNNFADANVPSSKGKPKRTFSLATRRKLAASQRARWARIKAAGKQLKIAKKAA